MNEKNKSSFKDELKFPSISDHQKFLHEKTSDLADEFYIGNSFAARKYMCYLTAAIFLTYKEMYPDLCDYIPFRTKSFDSFLKNLNKEFHIQIGNFDDSSLNDLDSLIDGERIANDINALTVVLDHIDRSKTPKNNYLTDEINYLYKKGLEAELLINDLDCNLDTVFLSEQEFFNYKIHILELLNELSFPEFTSERPMSYKEELDNIKETYAKKLSTNSFIFDATPYEIEDLKILKDNLRHILYDKLQYLVLQETFPKVISQPIFTNFLKVNFSFGKDSRKTNGFASTYYYLDTPFGRIEVQLQSSERYLVAKKGPAAHSLMADKIKNLDNLFELTDPNDKYPLEYYLEILNKTPVTNIRYDIIKPTFNNISEEKQFYSSEIGIEYRRSERLKELQSHIKLKDYLVSKHKIPGTEEFTTEKTPINQVILSIAEFSSPYMNVCSSAHTNFSTVSIHHKNLVSEFSEVLRRKDSMTCTGDMVVHRLAQIVENPSQAYQGLPKELSIRDIVNYSKEELLKEDELSL